LFGIYLRRKLYETPQFEKLKKFHKLDTEKFYRVINNNKKEIGIGIAYSVINASTFYLIATYIPSYLSQILGFRENLAEIISFCILILTTVLLPVFGAIGDKFDVKKIMISSAFLIIILLFPLYIAVTRHNLFFLSLIGLLYIVPITFISALLGFLLANLFSTRIRYTGVGLAWNIADGIFGSFTPAIALVLLKYTANEATFCWYILVCAMVSLVSYFSIKR
jgi:MFS transporter, MHS family, proline/betaine transporter